MAAEDEAMPVGGVSLSDPDNERYLRVNVWAEKGRVSLPGAADTLLDVEEGVDEDGEGDGSFAVVGNETALNLALRGLVYFPPPDWTSFKQVRRSRRAGLDRWFRLPPEALHLVFMCNVYIFHVVSPTTM